MSTRPAWLLLISFALPLGACGDMCGSDEIVSVTSSPGGRFDAVLFQRSCGATTGFSTQISVVAHGERPTGRGDAFIADDDHGLARRGAWNGPWADVRWLGRDRLLVRYAARSRIFKQAQPEVRIVYQAVEAP